MAWSDVEDNEVGANLVGATLRSLLQTSGRAAAQEWGMELVKNRSAEEIRELSERWPPEVLDLMAEILMHDERFV